MARRRVNPDYRQYTVLVPGEWGEIIKGVAKELNVSEAEVIRECIRREFNRFAQSLQEQQGEAVKEG